MATVGKVLQTLVPTLVGVGLFVLSDRRVWRRVEPSMMVSMWRLDRAAKRPPSSGAPMRWGVRGFGIVLVALSVYGLVYLAVG